MAPASLPPPLRPSKAVPKVHLSSCLAFNNTSKRDKYPWYMSLHRCCRSSGVHEHMSLKSALKTRAAVVTYASLWAATAKVIDPATVPEIAPELQESGDLDWNRDVTVWLKHCEPAFVLHLMDFSHEWFLPIHKVFLHTYGYRLLALALAELEEDDFLGSYTQILLRCLSWEHCKDIVYKLMRNRQQEFGRFIESAVNKIYAQRQKIAGGLVIEPAHVCCIADWDYRRLALLDILRDVWKMSDKLAQPFTPSTYDTYWLLINSWSGMPAQTKKAFYDEHRKMVDKDRRHPKRDSNYGCKTCKHYHCTSTVLFDTYLWNVFSVTENHRCSKDNCPHCRPLDDESRGRSERSCGRCHRVGAAMQCTKCRAEYFCDQSCFKAAWKAGHSLYCVPGDLSTDDFTPFEPCYCGRYDSDCSYHSCSDDDEVTTEEESGSDGESDSDGAPGDEWE